MKIFLTGKDGQVGFALHKKLSALGEVIALDRKMLDLSNINDIKECVDEVRPQIIINAAAYTAVDQAEYEPDLAYQVNAVAPKILSEKATEHNIPLIHFSTNYVFDGLKKEAYSENDLIQPLSVYGKSKAEGEFAVMKHPKHIILRTSWIFGARRHNFLKTVLHLLSERDKVSMVNDQWGNPTSVCTLANITFKILDTLLNDVTFKKYGIYHVTNEGETNWHDYAIFIAREAQRLEFPIRTNPNFIESISALDYPTPASRPLNSRLNIEKIKKTFMLELPHWQDEVKKVLNTLSH